MASQDSEGAFSEKRLLVFGDFILGFKNSSCRKGTWRWPSRGCRLEAPSPQPGKTWAAAMRRAAAAGQGRGCQFCPGQPEKPDVTTNAESGFSDEATEAQRGEANGLRSHSGPEQSRGENPHPCLLPPETGHQWNTDLKVVHKRHSLRQHTVTRRGHARG